VNESRGEKKKKTTQIKAIRKKIENIHKYPTIQIFRIDLDDPK
jgi:hypothetical protein